jgi:hypothetical protein
MTVATSALPARSPFCGPISGHQSHQLIAICNLTIFINQNDPIRVPIQTNRQIRAMSDNGFCRGLGDVLNHSCH